jgi:hypothetical protein
MVSVTVVIAAGLVGDLLWLPALADLVRLPRVFDALAIVGSLGYSAATVGLVIVVPMWAYRCQRNLPGLGASGLRYSPAWAAGAWFIPLGNLVVCYNVVREIWLASAPNGRGEPLVWLWWAYWLAATSLWIVGLVTVLMTDVGSGPRALGAHLITFGLAIWPLSWGLLALLGWQVVHNQDTQFRELSRRARD